MELAEEGSKPEALRLGEGKKEQARGNLEFLSKPVIFGSVPVPFFRSLFPLIAKPSETLLVSAGVTLLALLIFGMVKGLFCRSRTRKSGLQTVMVGGLAAAASFGLVKLVS